MNAIYLYGPAGKIAKKVNDITDNYHTDHLGSTKLVTSKNGTVTEEIMYESFGEQINTTEERYTFNGKEKDEISLYYYGARCYSAVIGYFISRDSLTGEKESPQTLSRYTYSLNNVMNADGTSQKNLTNNPAVDRDPSKCCQPSVTEKYFCVEELAAILIVTTISVAVLLALVLKQSCQNERNEKKVV